jgi:prepilin-type N-terminal cleavage/methylation domain-containing protein
MNKEMIPMRYIRSNRRKSGFTLIEAMIAMVVLSFGILSLATVYTQGLQASNRSQIAFIAQQKAQQAMETIYTARNSGTLTFTNIANVSQGGVFLDGAQALCNAGPDGVLGTADDNCAIPDVIVTGPGPDQVLGTADDTVINLNPWMTRTIAITPVAGIQELNQITITVNYVCQGQPAKFVLVSYISGYA